MGNEDPVEAEKKGGVLMPPEALAQIIMFIRSGFYSRDAILAILREEMYAPGNLDEVELHSKAKV